jgi:ankyrin repeat protein
MDKQLEELFERLRDLPDFFEIDMSDVNACGHDGDNALHVVVQWGDIGAAKLLIQHGIDVNKAGDLGYTPLHVACMRGNKEMVKLLVDNGADLFVLSEGYPPFTTARLAGQDAICEMLAPLMDQAQKLEPTVWLKARLGQLRREIAEIEMKLDEKKAGEGIV